MKVKILILLSVIMFSCLQRPIPDAIDGVKYEIIESSINFTRVVTYGYYDSVMISKFLKARNTDKAWFFHTPANSKRGDFYYYCQYDQYLSIYIPENDEFVID